jgi:hypothetical protein
MASTQRDPMQAATARQGAPLQPADGALAPTLASGGASSPPTAPAVVSPTPRSPHAAPYRRAAVIAAALGAAVALALAVRWAPGPGAMIGAGAATSTTSPGPDGSELPRAPEVPASPAHPSASDVADRDASAGAVTARVPSGEVRHPLASPTAPARPSAAPASEPSQGLAAGVFDEGRARRDLRSAIAEMRARCSKPEARGEVYVFWVRYDTASGEGTLGSAASVQTARNTGATALSCLRDVANARHYRVSPYAGKPREISEQIELR